MDQDVDWLRLLRTKAIRACFWGLVACSTGGLCAGLRPVGTGHVDPEPEPPCVGGLRPDGVGHSGVRWLTPPADYVPASGLRSRHVPARGLGSRDVPV